MKISSSDGKPQRGPQSAAHQQVAYLAGVVPDMALIGQVETGYLQDGEEQGYAQAFGQRGEGHDEHGGEQLPARNLDQAGNVLQKGAFGSRQLVGGKRGESPLPVGSGSGVAAGDRHASNDSRARLRVEIVNMGTGVGDAGPSTRSFGAPVGTTIRLRRVRIPLELLRFNDCQRPASQWRDQRFISRYGRFDFGATQDCPPIF